MALVREALCRIERVPGEKKLGLGLSNVSLPGK